MNKEIVRRKPYEELTITDDFMFCKVMQKEALCKELLRRILGKSVGEIVSINYQEVIDESYSAKGIRLDILVTTVSGAVYDVEMQAVTKKDLARRIRYYQSTLDTAHLDKGHYYDTLPDSFIIFLCPFDYMECGLPVYTFHTICEQDKEIRLQDGITKIILNSTASDKAESRELRAVLDYMNGKVTEGDPYIQDLEHAIADAKLNEKWRKDYMRFSPVEMDARIEGRAEGRAEGLEEGLAKGRAVELLDLVRSGLLSEEIAAMRLNISVEELEEKLHAVTV